MPLVPILESKSKNGTQIFLKVLNWSPFLLKRLKFALFVKSRLTPLEGVPHVSFSIFWIFYYFLLLFFIIFYYLLFIIYFWIFKKNKKIVTCQAVIVPRGSDRVMWQWQWHVSVLCQVSFP